MKKKIRNIICVSTCVLLITACLIVSELLNPRHKVEQTTTKTTSTDIIITESTTTSTTKTTVKTTKKKTTRKAVVNNTPQKKTGGYKITHYGHDCKGCSGTGKTASGYSIKNTIYYNDSTYGTLRIVAMKNLPLYSVIVIKNYKLGGDIHAIVLDRGVGSGVIDLAVESEKKAYQLGIQKNVQIEVLRTGR